MVSDCSSKNLINIYIYTPGNPSLPLVSGFLGLVANFLWHLFFNSSTKENNFICCKNNCRSAVNIRKVQKRCCLFNVLSQIQSNTAMYIYVHVQKMISTLVCTYTHLNIKRAISIHTCTSTLTCICICSMVGWCSSPRWDAQEKHPILWDDYCHFEQKSFQLPIRVYRRFWPIPKWMQAGNPWNFWLTAQFGGSSSKPSRFSIAAWFETRSLQPAHGPWTKYVNG